MGACKIDIHAKERSYTQRYALNDAAGVKALLRDRYKIGVRRYSGDVAASDILIDLASAINSAGLTDRQTEAIALVYGKWGLTLEEAGAVMRCTKQGVKAFVDGAAGRIAAVYQRWEYGEITVELSGVDEGAGEDNDEENATDNV